MTYDETLRSECAKAGAQYKLSKGGKHMKAHISMNGRSRFVIYPLSPSDSRRGALNFAGDIRRAIRKLG